MRPCLDIRVLTGVQSDDRNRKGGVAVMLLVHVRI